LQLPNLSRPGPSSRRLAAMEISLVRVSIRVLYIGLASSTFCLSSYTSFFIFPSRYFFAIGLPMYLALDAHTTPSYCTTKQYYSSSLLLCARAVTASGSSFHRIPQDLHNRTLPLELLPVRSPLLGKSKFVSSPVLTDMLKSRTSSCIAASLQPHAVRRVCRILYVGPRPGSLSIP